MIEPAVRIPPADESKAVTDEYIKAVNLNRRIITAAQLAQQSLYEMCMERRGSILAILFCGFTRIRSLSAAPR